jgi:hypothetical protein
MNLGLHCEKLATNKGDNIRMGYGKLLCEDD